MPEGATVKTIEQRRDAALRKLYGEAKPLVLHFREGVFIGFCFGLAFGLAVAIGAAALFA